MVTSDPSPAYISRVAAAFNDNGIGMRGDMKAVIRAILLDPEARGDVKTAPRYGKMREPVQIITNIGRIFPAKAFNGGDVSDGALSVSASTMAQNPFYSPTVFNYFAPDYVIPGTTILAPEFDIFNSGTSVKRTNFLSVYIFNGIPPNATDSLRGTSLDFSEFVPFSEADPSGNLLLDAERKDDARSSVACTPGNDNTCRSSCFRIGTDRVRTAYFSDDDARIITASFDMTARIWDVKTGEQLHNLAMHMDRVREARFSRDGKLAASAGFDGGALIWDTKTGDTVRLLLGHTAPLYSAVFNPDATRLVTCSDDRTAIIWKLTPASSAPNAAAANGVARLQLLPNPAAGETVLRLPAPAETTLRVAVTTVAGETVMVKEVAVGESALVIPVGLLPAGIYHVAVEGGKQQWRTGWLHVSKE